MIRSVFHVDRSQIARYAMMRIAIQREKYIVNCRWTRAKLMQNLHIFIHFVGKSLFLLCSTGPTLYLTIARNIFYDNLVFMDAFTQRAFIFVFIRIFSARILKNSSVSASTSSHKSRGWIINNRYMTGWKALSTRFTHISHTHFNILFDFKCERRPQVTWKRGRWTNEHRFFVDNGPSLNIVFLPLKQNERQRKCEARSRKTNTNHYFIMP